MFYWQFKSKLSILYICNIYRVIIAQLQTKTLKKNSFEKLTYCKY